MAEFVSLLKTVVICGTLFFMTFVVLLSLPKSRMRSVCLEMAKYVIAGGLVLLTISPVDVLPDVVPLVGWADDLGYIIGAVAAVRSGLHERKVRAELPE